MALDRGATILYLVSHHFKVKVLENILTGNRNLRDLLRSPVALAKTREVEWKGFSRVPKFCFHLLKLVYRKRQYEECQQVSAITVTYLQVKLAQLCVFLVVWHSVQSHVAVKP